MSSGKRNTSRSPSANFQRKKLWEEQDNDNDIFTYQFEATEVKHEKLYMARGMGGQQELVKDGYQISI